MMLYDRLETRVMLASVTGRVYNDADSSTTFDAGETGYRGTAVYLDANANGRYDSGEPQALTDKKGVYTFKDVAAGDWLVGVLPAGGLGHTAPGPAGTIKGAFDIELTGLDGLTAVVRRAFEQAAERWESIITGDLPDVGGIDDVRISVSVDTIDGDGGTLAQAGPDDYRAGSLLPYTGDMEFDSADVPTLVAEGHLVDTVTHEMAHVLGFGTIWSDLGLLSGQGTRHPTFLGRQATKAYDELFGTSADGVPVENRGGDGTADSHWPERTFAEELMTGYDEDAATAEPLSRVTVAQFADLGYQVNTNAADVWDPIRHTTTTTTALDLGGEPFERRVTVGRDGSVAGVDFGLRADTAPTIGRFRVSDATLGDAVTLRAYKLRDAENDAVAGIGFYADTNSVAGLQRGRGGDTFLGDAALINGVYTATVPTAALSAGTQAYYAVVSDTLGLTARRGTTATLVAPPPPARPTPAVATRQTVHSLLVQWRDRSDNEIGFRVEVYADPQYDAMVRRFNVPAGSVSALVGDLAHGEKYYVRVRAYGYGGASGYTRLSGVRV